MALVLRLNIKTIFCFFRGFVSSYCFYYILATIAMQYSYMKYNAQVWNDDISMSVNHDSFISDWFCNLTKKGKRITYTYVRLKALFMSILCKAAYSENITGLL